MEIKRFVLTRVVVVATILSKTLIPWKDSNRVRFLVYLLSLFLLAGCAKSVQDIAIIDRLKHPTKFPDIYTPTALDIERILAENPLPEEEKIKIVPLGETKYSSLQMTLIRQDIEVPTHYHKNHDEVVHIKKGRGIVILDGTRYYVKEGMVILIPRRVRHKFINTGEGTHVALSVFYPPYTGDDIKFVKEKRPRKREE